MQTEHEFCARRESRLLWTRLGLAALLATLSACYVGVREPIHEVNGVYASEDLYFSESPPAAQTEVIVGVAPGPDYVWVGGYWTRHREGWFWVGGRWAARPHTSAVWEQGRWERHPRGFVWVRGRWKFRATLPFPVQSLRGSTGIVNIGSVHARPASGSRWELTA